MAQVIKQQTQVFNKPVGVIRTAGGAEQLGQTISRVAGALAENEYRVAAQDAQDVGAKAGMAVSSSKVAEIDPTTNMPVAYVPPPTFGRIATGAYQDLIDKRFADSVKIELEAKGSEVAASSNSAAQYKSRMSNYVEAMYNAGGEQTAYTRMISEGGAEYITSTYTVLRKKEIAAEKKAVLRESELSDYRASLKLQQAISARAPSEEIQTLINDRIVSNQNRLAAGGSVSSYIAADKSIRESYALFVNNELSSVYSSLSKENQAKVILSLTDTSALDSISTETGITELKGLVVDALVGTTVSSLRGGLNAITTAQAGLDSIQTTADQEFAKSVFEDNESTITPSTTMAQMQVMVSDIQDPELKRQTLNNLFFNMVTKAGDTEIGANVNVMDRVTAALKSDDPTALDSLQGVVDPQFIENLKAIPRADRGDLAKDLSDRRQELASIDAFNNAQSKSARVERAESSLDNLLETFMGFNKVQKAELIAALKSPEAMAAFEKANKVNLSADYSIAASELGDDKVRTALTQVSSDTLAKNKARKEQREGAVNTLVDKSKGGVTSSTSDGELRKLVSSLDGKAAQDEAFHKLKLVQLEAAVSGSANTSDAIDKLTIALRNPSAEALESLGGIVDKRVISDLKGLSTDERRDLATNIETVRSAVNREENLAAANTLEGFKSRSIALSQSLNLVSDYNTLVSDIEKSNVTEKQTLINSVTAKYSDLAYDKFLDLGIEDSYTIDRMLTELRTGSVKDLTSLEEEALSILKPLHQANVSSTESRLTRTIEVYKNRKADELKSSQLDLIKRQINVGVRVEPEKFEQLEADMFKGKPQTIASLIDNEIVAKALENGVMFPALGKSISRAMNGSNEANIRLATDLFEKYSGATTTTEQGVGVTVDLMRQYLDAATYNKLSAVSFVARDESMDAVEVLLNFRAYGGINEIDAELKANLEIPKSTSVEDWLRTKDMSPEYRKEIASLMRIRQSRGVSINEDDLDGIIDDYESEMTKDPYTIGPRIGDRVANSPSLYFYDKEIAINTDQLADALVNDPSGQWDFLLTAGGVTEAKFKAVNPAMYLTLLNKTLNLVGGEYKDAIQHAQDFRSLQGKRSLNVKPYYKAIGTAFDTGEKVYGVYYEGENGYQPFAPNGVLWTLTKEYKPTTNFVLQSLNNYQTSINSNASGAETDALFLRYLSAMHEFDIDSVLQDGSVIRMLQTGTIGSEAEVLEIVNESKKMNEDMR